ncbi:MAG: hypothetical protein ACTHJW_00125 [Streptosporangiaceae bacterium]
MTDQGYPPHQPDHAGASRRPGRTSTPHEPRRSGWQVIDAFDDRLDEDSDLPPWAGPSGIEPLRPARRAPRVREADRRPAPERLGEPPRPDDPRRLSVPGDDGRPADDRPGRLRRGPRRGRAAAARRRRSKRRLITWGSLAIAAVVFTGLGIYLSQSPAPKSPYVTQLQKGEFSAVPDACKVVGAPVLHQIMNGTPRIIQPQQGKSQSECTFTVDATPVFRVMNVNLQALRASLVPVGNGSATANARFTFKQQWAQLVKPPKHTAQPPATVTSVPGLGQQAISAVQTFRDKGSTEKVIVLARYRNVLILVSVQGQSGNGFGPVAVGELRSGALMVARAALTGLKALPTV